MDTSPQPTDEVTVFDATVGLLERARLFILDMMAFVDGIFGRLGSVPLSPKLARHLTRDALVPAEAALRRAILLLAADLPIPVLHATKPRAAPDAAKPRAPAVSPKPDTKPRFSMSEPPPRDQNDAGTHPETDYLAEDQLPRTIALTDALLQAPPAAASATWRAPAPSSARCPSPSRPPASAKASKMTPGT